MQPFQEANLTLDNYWRAIILYGRNVASYKFALAQSLLELGQQNIEVVPLETLAGPFARHVCEHLEINDKQATSPSSKFLDACRAFNAGTITHDELIDATIRLGFVNVIDAFHIVNRDEIPVRFFEDERNLSAGGIRLTEAFCELRETPQARSLPGEVDARWRLVETAWSLNLPRVALTVDYETDTGLLLPDRRRFRRQPITGTREALNGYQKGKCFYCFRDISTEAGADDLADVDHFFPHTLKPHRIAEPVDGVWNLVLACQECNRGPSGKFAQLPAPLYLERLNTRNDYLIASHHPLRETLRQQTGTTASARRIFLQRTYRAAQALLIHTWSPEHEFEPAF